MGGEGSMMAANNSLKNNRSLVAKRKETKALSGSYANSKIKEFPKATPEELIHIKEKIILENKRIRTKQLIIVTTFLCVIVLFLIIYF